MLSSYKHGQYSQFVPAVHSLITKIKGYTVLLTYLNILLVCTKLLFGLYGSFTIFKIAIVEFTIEFL